MNLSRRAAGLSPSVTLAITAQANALRAEGIDVVGFGAGQPDFPTPEHIVAAGQRALEEGFTRYTPTPGLPEVREAVAAWHRQRHDLDVSADETVICCGAKHALANICQCLLDDGDEAIIPTPYWLSYPEMVRLAGGVPRFVPTDVSLDYKMTPDQLAGAIGPRTRLLFLNSPSNPTGSAYGLDELRALAEVLLRWDKVWIVSDDIYSELIYDNKTFRSILHAEPALKSRAVVVNGVSKTYSMTGWRIGWACAPSPFTRAMASLQSHTTSNAAAVSQRAALAALTGPMDFFKTWKQAFERRRNRMVSGLNDDCGLPCRLPRGAFYAFADARSVLGRKTPGGTTLENDLDLCKYLLDEARVAVVPGEAFGAPGHIRLSYATDEATIGKGLQRMAESLSRLLQ